MEQEDFKQQWNAILHERLRLSDQRTVLETDLSEVNNKIQHLEEVLRHLAPLAGFDHEASISALGITDAIRHVLKDSNSRLSAAEVRAKLVGRGFDFDGHTAPDASIYKILNRLSVDGGEVKRTKEDGKVFYEWIITEDDIPF
jgi:hypothetical protein